jgi:hypothetical protein
MTTKAYKQTSSLQSRPAGKSRTMFTLLAWLAISPMLTSCVGTASSIIPPQPTQKDAWLSFKFQSSLGTPGCGTYQNQTCGLTDDAEAAAYYNGPGIANRAITCNQGVCNYTFQDWLTANGFAAATQVAKAIYFNKLDLQFGREMNCWQNGQTVACYVVNYGPKPTDATWPDRITALDDAKNHTHPPFATVAMVYNPAITTNPVSFYVFNNGGSQSPLDPATVPLVTQAALDTEGGKTVPRMCMGCHGGSYIHSDATTNPPTPASVLGAQFLPFDVISFGLDSDTTVQQAFLDLNAFVLATKPNQAIVEFVNGTYPGLTGGVTQPFAQSITGTPTVDFIPANWNRNVLYDGTTPTSNQSQTVATLYSTLVRNYCRMCHLAQPRDFATYDVGPGNFKSDSGLIEAYTCVDGDMPHMEVPFGPQNVQNLSHASIGLWNEVDSQAREALHNFLQSINQNTKCGAN